MRWEGGGEGGDGCGWSGRCGDAGHEWDGVAAGAMEVGGHRLTTRSHSSLQGFVSLTTFDFLGVTADGAGQGQHGGPGGGGREAPGAEGTRGRGIRCTEVTFGC